jgi:hypothetical protein
MLGSRIFLIDLKTTKQASSCYFEVTDANRSFRVPSIVHFSKNIDTPDDLSIDGEFEDFAGQ